MAGKRMRETAKKTKEVKKEEGLIKRGASAFKARLIDAKKATIILFVMILLSIITGILGYYLYTPAKELYVLESTLQSETRKIYDFPKDSEERNAQQVKADEAQEVFATVVDKYTADTNSLISNYAKIHSNFIKLMIAVSLVAPFVAIGIMFIGGPINFLFAIINIIIVAPCKAIKYLFNCFREKSSKDSKEDKKSKAKQSIKKDAKKPSSKHSKKLETA